MTEKTTNEFFPRNSEGVLCAEGVSLEAVAEEFGTPCYVYSRAAILAALARIKKAFAKSKPAIHYAVKANGNIALLRLIAQTGAGFDIVSGGELARVLAAGGDAGKTVFSGVGKSKAEIARALQAGVGGINAESEQELLRIEFLAAECKKQAPVSLRINPGVDGGAHPHLATGLAQSKFGIAAADVLRLAKYAAHSSSLYFAGLSCHLGSQIKEAAAFSAAAATVARHREELRAEGIAVARINMGGGFAVDYSGGESALSLEEYDAALAEYFPDAELAIEPGRSICAAAGILLCRVEYEKIADGKLYWIVDAGMNDFLRPALYSAAHRVATVREGEGELRAGDIAGPVCESADILARDCKLRAAAGDLIALLDAGAYGSAMASNYNARPRPCEVLAEEKTPRKIRRRETEKDLLSPEQNL